LVEVFKGGLPFGNLIQGFMETLVANAARRALSAGFFHGKFEVEFSYRYHAVVFVHYNHTARAHHGATGKKVIIINGRIEVFLGKASARGTTCLNGFKLLAALDTTADLED